MISDAQTVMTWVFSQMSNIFNLYTSTMLFSGVLAVCLFGIVINNLLKLTDKRANRK